MGMVRLRLRWGDDCTYQLFNRTVLRGTEPFPTNRLDTLTIHMVSVDDKGFSYEARATFVDQVYSGHQSCESATTPVP